MKKVLITLSFVVGLFSITYSQTLYNGWVSFSSTYLGSNEYEYSYTWGASTTLNQNEIDNLFPYETGPYCGDGWYRRTSSGIGTQDFGFYLSWDNPVDILQLSTIGTEFLSDPRNKTDLYTDEILGDWWDRRLWNQNRVFSFRTKGYTGLQNIVVNIDYFVDYTLVSGDDRPFLCYTSGAPLRATGSFGVAPEPSTLLLLGSGFLALTGLARYRSKKKR